MNVSEKELSEEYERKYFQILKKLNIKTPTHVPKVSDHIQEIQEVISKLINKQYVSQKTNNKDITFDVKKIKEYGELSKQKLKNLNNLNNDFNFCLWKITSVGKTWDSPWGKGRPGWHTECFTFIDKYAQGQIDIHGGGVDLKFPHHENENAQCRAIYNKPLAKIWIHIGQLITDTGKISKSQNLKYLVKDLINKYSPNLIRFLFLTNKYSLPFLISDEKLEQINKDFDDFSHTLNKAKTNIYLYSKNKDLEFINTKIDEDFLKQIEENLNMPNILTWLQSIKKQLLINIKDKDVSKTQTTYIKLKTHLEWLGFVFEDKHTEENKQLLSKWKQMIDMKKYKEADEIRNYLINIKIL